MILRVPGSMYAYAGRSDSSHTPAATVATRPKCILDRPLIYPKSLRHTTCSLHLVRNSMRWLAVALFLAMGTVAVLLWVVSSTEFVRDRAVDALNARFESQVELGSMEVGVFPTLSVGGTDLHLRHMGRTDVPPLISVGAFEASAGLYGLYGRPFHLRTVTLGRLEIRLPPGGMKLLPKNDTRASRNNASPIILDEIRSTA